AGSYARVSGRVSIDLKARRRKRRAVTHKNRRRSYVATRRRAPGDACAEIGTCLCFGVDRVERVGNLFPRCAFLADCVADEVLDQPSRGPAGSRCGANLADHLARPPSAAPWVVGSNLLRMLSPQRDQR